MSLAGQGAVAIWHDIAPEGRAAFYAWHGLEHMPERVAIPGFRRGRRYIAIEGGPEFFNLYETDSPTTPASAEYMHRLNHPTAWSRSTIPHFRNVARSVCRVEASHGEGQGGLLATLRYDVPAARRTEHRRYLVLDLLPGLGEREGVAGAHLLLADLEVSRAETAEKKARGGGTLVPAWIILLEGWGDERQFRELCRDALAPDEFAKRGAEGAALTLYRFQSGRGKAPWAAA